MNKRNTIQKETVARIVKEACDHPTAEMVFEKAKVELPTISLGTVYRNLRQLVQEGRLRQMDGPVVRFDSKTELHSHARCVSCGTVVDLDEVAYDKELDGRVGNGWQIIEHTLVFNGLCPGCIKKQHI